MQSPVFNADAFIAPFIAYVAVNGAYELSGGLFRADYLGHPPSQDVGLSDRGAISASRSNPVYTGPQGLPHPLALQLGLSAGLSPSWSLGQRLFEAASV